MQTRKECAVTQGFVRTVFMLLIRATFSTKYRNRKFKVSTKSKYKIQVARVKLSNLISKSKFINTNQMSINLLPVMHLYALQSYTSTPPVGRTACTKPQCLYKGALFFFVIWAVTRGVVWQLPSTLPRIPIAAET
jgi:hypothetical protein